jgi:hypothetical protein
MLESLISRNNSNARRIKTKNVEKVLFAAAQSLVQYCAGRGGVDERDG